MIISIPPIPKIKLQFSSIDKFLSNYTYVTTHPQIKYFEGSYDQVIRHKTFSGNEFVFKDSEGTMGFYISLHSKEKIYPNDFEEGVKYRIFYEDRTSIIVKVEKLGP